MIDKIQNAGTEVVEAKAGTGSATLSMVSGLSYIPCFQSNRGRFCCVVIRDFPVTMLVLGGLPPE